MSQREKLVQRILAQPAPKDFTWDEAKRLLRGFGYEIKVGAGSRRKFVDPNGRIIILHEPHPQSVLKTYQVREIVDQLKEAGLL